MQQLRLGCLLAVWVTEKGYHVIYCFVIPRQKNNLESQQALLEHREATRWQVTFQNASLLCDLTWSTRLINTHQLAPGGQSYFYLVPTTLSHAVRFQATDNQPQAVSAPLLPQHKPPPAHLAWILAQSRHPSVTAAWSFSSSLSHAGTELAADFCAYAVTRYTAHGASPMDGRHRQVAPFTKKMEQKKHDNLRQ